MFSRKISASVPRAQAKASRKARAVRYAVDALEPRLLLTTNAWKSAVSGDWDTGSNWSLGHVPTASEDVSITVAGSYTVTHDNGFNDSAKSVTISAGVELGGGSLTVTGAVSVTGGALSLNGVTLAKATLSTSGSGQVLVVGNPVLDGVTLNTNLTVSSNHTLFFYHANTLGTGKKINVNDATVYLYDQSDGGASLLGTGEVVLGGTSGGNLYLYNGYGHAANVASTVLTHGFGQVYFYGGVNNSPITADVNGKTLTVTGATWTNKSKLSAVNGGILSIAGTWTNTSPGTLSESNSTLTLGGTITGNPVPTRTGGTISLVGIDDLGGSTLALTATTGSWNIQAGTLKNGTLNASGGAALNVVNSATLDKVTLATGLTVPASTTLFLFHADTLGSGQKLVVNDATLYLYDQSDGGASLLGTGEVVLGGTNGGNFYLYNGYGHAANIASTVLTHGFGQVYFYGGVNNSPITADVNGKTLSVTGATWSNKGKLSAVNGGILSVSGTWGNSSPGTLSEVNSTLDLAGTISGNPIPTRTGGTINLQGIDNLAGGTLALTATTGSWNLASGTVKNGSLSTTGGAALTVVSSGTLDQMNILTSLNLTSGSLLLYHANTLAVGATLSVDDASLYLYDQPDAGASLTGGGDVKLAGVNGGTYYLYNGYSHLPNSAVLVHGYGTVYSYGGNNNGVISADVSGKTLNINGTITNLNLVRAAGGATLTLQAPSTFTNQGAIAAETGTVVIGGAFNAGTGTFDIGVGGTGAGSTYGVINVQGALTMGGNFNAYLVNGYHPGSGVNFTPLKYTSKTGAFASMNLNDGNNFGFTATVGSTSLTLKSSTSVANVASVSGGVITLAGTSAADTLAFSTGPGIIIATRNGVGSIFSSAGITGVSVNGRDGNDVITAGVSVPATLLGGNGNDTMTGGGNNDSLDGGAGNDSLNGGAGSDTIVGGDGSDTMLGGSGNDTFRFANATAAEADVVGESAGQGFDTLDFGGLTTAVTINLGSDTLATMANRTVKTLTAGQWANVEGAVGGSGNDTITANHSGDSLSGGAGNDTFFASNGVKDSIDGGTGTDVVSSKDASDVLTNIP